MAGSQTAKSRSRVTGWLPHLDNGSRFIWIGFAAALVAAVIVVWSARSDLNTAADGASG